MSGEVCGSGGGGTQRRELVVTAATNWRRLNLDRREIMARSARQETARPMRMPTHEWQFALQRLRMHRVQVAHDLAGMRGANKDRRRMCKKLCPTTVEGACVSGHVRRNKSASKFEPDNNRRLILPRRNHPSICRRRDGPFCLNRDSCLQV